MRAEETVATQSPSTRRVLLVREHAVPDKDYNDHSVHLLPLPLPHIRRAEQAGALCGRRMHPDQIEPVAPGDGEWCQLCFVAHVTGQPAHSGISSPGIPAVDHDSAVAGYRELDWPITLRGRDIVLNLDPLQAVAIVVPALLSTEVTEILDRRRCPPPCWPIRRCQPTGLSSEVSGSRCR